jgi:catechol 2,3-dioxygenase-like lactoylglutathione lyase family enzyme
MIRTAGLHISLAVRDPERALQFYSSVFGLVEVARDGDWITANGPGDGDLWAFEKDERAAGQQGGVRHLGFRLMSPDDLEEAISAVERAGGQLLNRGADDRTSPYAYVSDPDGYVLELWCE